MSWEAWGAGAEFDPPDGFVADEVVDELETEAHEARVLLSRAYMELSSPWTGGAGLALSKEIDKWLDANTPKVNQSETWRRALAREVKERSPQS